MNGTNLTATAGATTTAGPSDAGSSVAVRSMELPAFTGPSFVRLVRVELRKSLDTRAGAALVALLVLATLVPIGWQLTHMTDGAPEFSAWAGVAQAGAILFTPVLGILAMTSEWTQRTALTTFSLVPRRGRVVGAKLAAAATIGLAVMTVSLGLAAAATLLGAAVKGTAPVWDDAGRTVAGALVASALNVLMGAAFGALAMQTAVAVALFFVTPTTWQIVGALVLKDDAQWLDVWSAFGRLSQFDTAGHWGPIATSLLAWVAVPLVAGTLRSLRRNVS